MGLCACEAQGRFVKKHDIETQHSAGVTGRSTISDSPNRLIQSDPVPYWKLQ